MNKFYITTSIGYVNAKPHLGHALEAIQADVLARYRRQKGDAVFFLTGTDEHGAKITRAAKQEGKTPQELADENSAKFQALKPVLNLSFDDFIRTTDKERHWPAAQRIWSKLAATGDLYRKKYRGLYCVGHEAFVTEKDLVNGQCADHQTVPEVIEEENWFFRLSKYSQKISQLIKTGELKVIPETRRNEILSFISEGLEDVSFSRPRKDLGWGIPVPDDPDSTMYVWCDALVNYISAIGYADENPNLEIQNSSPKADPPLAEKFARWWPADVHLIGKDILRFHAAIWPGMLLSAGLALPKAILVHGHITVDGRKMSKTVGNVVDPVELKNQYGTDALRYYLLREIPSSEDGDFSVKKFKDRYNGDLANGLGNFAARVLTLAERAEAEPNRNAVEKEVDEKIKKTRAEADQKIEEFKLHEALVAVWELIAFGDRYVNEKKPWQRSATGDKRQATSDGQSAIYNAIVILDNLAALLTPFLPETAEKITRSIKWENNRLEVKKIGILFPRLD